MMASLCMKAIFCAILCVACSSFITNIRNSRIAHDRYTPLSLATTTTTSNPWDDILQRFFVQKDSKTSSQKSASLSSFRSIAITGATGLVGRQLTEYFEGQNIKVIKISQSSLSPADKSTATFQWSPSDGKFEDYSAALEGVDAVIHLAGENVASGEGILKILGRWTDSKKQKILSSRVDSTKLLVDSLAQLKKKPKLLLSASAVGFYGYDDAESLFDESAGTKGNGYLAEVCEQWEQQALRADKELGIRTVCLRFAPILSSRAGLLAKLLPIFGLGVGGVIGSGKQGFSWVSLSDVVRAVVFLLSDVKANKIRGPVNICSPNPSDNAGFTSAMGSALSRPVIFPVPEIAAGLVFGEMGKEMLLGGQRVAPSKLSKAGFQFLDTDLVDAIKKESTTSQRK